MTYKAKEFNIPEIKGISKKQIEEHLKLYQGYVKHVGAISAQIKEWTKTDREKNSYVIQELWRRLGFEFNGMKNHEYYFGALEGGPKEFDKESAVGKAIESHYGYKGWREIFTHLGKTRGSGWAILYYDKTIEKFLVGWVDEHHLGFFSSVPILIAMDCWEHAYMVDYLPSERAKYIDSYLDALNWEVINENFLKAQN